MTPRITCTVPDAAKILDVPKTSAYECVQRGEIASLSFGHRIVIARSDLEDLVGPLTDISSAQWRRQPDEVGPSAPLSRWPPDSSKLP